MSNPKIESSQEQKLSKESIEFLEHIAEILADKFVEAIKKKKQGEDKEQTS
jgi:hypothetical protein